MPKRKLPPPSGLSPFERGLSAESAFCDLLSRASRGGLHFARPAPDDHGVDRLAYREGSPYPLRLQFKAATRAGARGDWQFQLDLTTVPVSTNLHPPPHRTQIPSRAPHGGYVRARQTSSA